MKVADVTKSQRAKMSIMVMIKARRPVFSSNKHTAPNPTRLNTKKQKKKHNAFLNPKLGQWPDNAGDTSRCNFHSFISGNSNRLGWSTGKCNHIRNIRRTVSMPCIREK